MTKRKTSKPSAEKSVRDIRRATRRKYSAEEKIRIVMEGLRAEESIAELCRKEGISGKLLGQRVVSITAYISIIYLTTPAINENLVVGGFHDKSNDKQSAAERTREISNLSVF